MIFQKRNFNIVMAQLFCKANASRIICFAVLFFTCTYITVEAKGLSVDDKSDLKAVIEKSYGKLPLSFIENQGQLNSDISYYSQFLNQSVYISKEKIRFDVIKEGIHSNFSLNFKNTAKGYVVSGEGKQEGKVSYFSGDKSNWKTGIPMYSSVVYKELYSGINMKIFGNGETLEYEFIVSPMADPKQLLMAYDEINGLEISPEGDLLIKTGIGSLKERKPYIYQVIEGKKVEVKGKFVLKGRQTEIKNQQFLYSFELSSYDNTHPLIIDPILVYSTYLGGAAYSVAIGGLGKNIDIGKGIAVGNDGSAYIVGSTTSTDNDFPLMSPYDPSYNGGASDIFITRLKPDGSGLIYSTYLGGEYNWDDGVGIALDSFGNAYITGRGESDAAKLAAERFPTTVGAYKEFAEGAFVTKIDPSGTTLEYSTFLSDDILFSTGIAVDTSGYAYVVANNIVSGDFFVIKVNKNGTGLEYSNSFGGSKPDVARSIAVDDIGNAYIVGMTQSSDFIPGPLVASAYDSSLGGSLDVFVRKLDPSGSDVFVTYLGGSGYEYSGTAFGGPSIAVDDTYNVFVTGGTGSPNFPIIPAGSAYQKNIAGGQDIFITKFAASGSSLVYSTYLGGNTNDMGEAIALDSTGNAYVTGYTMSTDFPVENAINKIKPSAKFTYDIFVTKINQTGSKLEFSTYYGGADKDRAYGIALDSAGMIYIAGETYSDPFVTPMNGFDTLRGGQRDAFVAKIDPAPSCDNNSNPKVVATPALSIAPTHGDGTGAVYQAYYKESVLGVGDDVKWTGYMRALWIDKIGNLHEDTVVDGVFDILKDYILKYDSSGSMLGKAKYKSTTGIIDVPWTLESVAGTSVTPIFEAGEELSKIDDEDRKVYTFVDLDKDGVCDGCTAMGVGESIEFTVVNKNTLRPFLRATNGGGEDKVDHIINFIRGLEGYDGTSPPGTAYRNRTVSGGKEWKLGDIVSSTPVAVGRPTERYDLIYKDSSYLAFLKAKEKRRTVVYVGANDGMLHAFNGGKFVPATTTTPAKYEGDGYLLGQELWSFIPYDLLPHLKKLTRKGYEHDFFVDLDVYVTDAKIFSTATHVNGWGTILIGGMKFGGAEIKDLNDTFNGSAKDRSFRSSYFALDITNPVSPKVMWRFTCGMNAFVGTECDDSTIGSNNLGFTTSYPAVTKVGNKWFLVLGSGPSVGQAEYANGYEGNSDRKPHIFILDLLSGELKRAIEIDIPPSVVGATPALNLYNGFMSDIVSVDADMLSSHSAEVIYAGVTYKDVTGWKGMVIRIPTNNLDNPAFGISPSILFQTDADQAITASVATYKKNFNLWVSFGTGKLFNDDDRQDLARQSFYNILDPCFSANVYNSACDIQVANSTNLANNSLFTVNDNTAGLAAFKTLKNTQETNVSKGAKQGWRLDLTLGDNAAERVLTHPVILDDLMMFTTYTPDGTTCKPDGISYLYALSFTTGTAYYDDQKTKILGEDGGTVNKKMSLGNGMSGSPLINIRNDNGIVKGKLYFQGNDGAIKNVDIPDPTGGGGGGGGGLGGRFVSGMSSWRNSR